MPSTFVLSSLLVEVHAAGVDIFHLIACMQGRQLGCASLSARDRLCVQQSGCAIGPNAAFFMFPIEEGWVVL